MKHAKKLPSQELLKELFDYNQNTGDLIWRVDKKHFRKGLIAGSLDKKSKYITIRINGLLYFAHRIVWKYVTGKDIDSTKEIDHKNRIKNDNRFKNLKIVTRSGNLHNRSLNKNNLSGKTGVHWSKDHKKWKAIIMINKKNIHLGYFLNLEDAIKARKEGELKYYGKYCPA